MRYSIEVSPETTREGQDSLFRSLEGYAERFPLRWASVTSSNRAIGVQPTLLLAQEMQRFFGWETAPHITGRGQSAEDLKTVVEALRRLELPSVVAVRGDDALTDGCLLPTGAHLIKALHELHPTLNISAACYPERHPESSDDEQDFAALQEKTRAGATQFITQFVLKPGILASFMEKVRAHGIKTPVVAGVVYPGNVTRINSLAKRWGIRPSPNYDIPTFHALCDEAERAGYAGVHIFTLNHPPTKKGALHASL